MSYHKHYSTRASPQTKRTPGRTDEVEGRAGGYVFEVDPWDQLDRFLILGVEAPTYYAGRQELIRENADSALKLIKSSDGERVVDRIVEISQSGRAAKNEPALFLLALASAEGDLETRRAAYAALSKVARISTHLFQFLNYRQAFGGWGRGLKRAVQSWYLERSTEDLAYQVVKYRQREGWTHRDVLRQAHPKGSLDPEKDVLFNWIVDEYDNQLVGFPAAPIVEGFIKIQKAKSPNEAASLILEYNLPREAVPTEFLNSPEVWESLLHSGKHGMPLHALLRNLNHLTRHEVLSPFSHNTQYVIKRITDRDALRHARVHPYNAMVALRTYSEGRGFRGSTTWDPVDTIVDALEATLEMSFEFVKPTGKNILIGLDVSGSMASSRIQNSNITAREGAAIMALVTARTESNYMIRAFSQRFIELDLRKTDSFRSALQKTSRLPFEGTDCALPMLYALGKRPIAGTYWQRGDYETFRNSVLDIDAFIVYTDSETWAGSIKPFQALQEYRKRADKPDAKLIVVGMTANNFTIADPRDPGMLDVVGFDSNAPSVIADFIRG